jgi:hypothetical protein
MNKRCYQLTLEAHGEPQDPEGVRRLPITLKRLLRSHRLRCVDVRPIESPRVPNPVGEYSYRPIGLPIDAPALATNRPTTANHT